jgi:hypothetical protein
MKNNLKAPLSISVGKPEINDGTNWFTIATENWVSNVIATIPACVIATTESLIVTYNNNTTGVGATLTNAGVQNPLIIDDIPVVVNNRVLVKDQATELQNGIYTVTTIGTAGVNWVLTRSADFDSSSQIIRGNSVNVISGTTNELTSWMVTSITGVVGPDAITFARLSQSIFNNILGTDNQIIVTVVDDIATISLAPDPILPGVGFVKIPSGDTSERPITSIAGMFRFNESL